MRAKFIPVIVALILLSFYLLMWGTEPKNIIYSLDDNYNNRKAINENFVDIAKNKQDVFIKTQYLYISSPTANCDFPFWQTPEKITITKVSAICINGTNVVGQLQEYNSTGGSAADIDSDWTITTSEYEDKEFTDSEIDAGDWLGWKTTSVSGAVSFLCITIEYE